MFLKIINYALQSFFISFFLDDEDKYKKMYKFFLLFLFIYWIFQLLIFMWFFCIAFPKNYLIFLSKMYFLLYLFLYIHEWGRTLMYRFFSLAFNLKHFHIFFFLLCIQYIKKTLCHKSFGNHVVCFIAPHMNVS